MVSAAKTLDALKAEFSDVKSEVFNTNRTEEDEE